MPPLPDPERLAVLLYTSGTSGRPRAAMLSHRALLANIEQVAAVDPPMIHGDDVVLGVLPLFHVYGLNAVLGQVLRQRARLVLVDGFDAQGTLDLIEDEAVHACVPVAPPVFAYWQRRRPTSSERLGPRAAGAVRLGAAVARAGRRVHRAHRHPGAPGLRADRGRAGGDLHPVQPGTLQPGSVGAALPGIEIRLVDEAGRAARGRGRRRDPDPGRQPVQRLLARRRRRPRRGRLVRRPATSASSTPTATCSWSTGSRSW